MLAKKFLRSLFAICLSCLLFLNSFTSPALADSVSNIEAFAESFWESMGGVIGVATGTVIVCYTVDVAIAPFAAPVAAYLAPMCPAIGAAVGGVGGVAATANVVGHT
jgi:hypothetical protein